MRIKFKTFLITFSLFTASFAATASPEDSVKTELKIPTVTRYIDENAFESQRVVFHSLDTTLNAVQVINPAVAHHYNFLTAIGSAPSSQVFIPGYRLFTDAGFHTYDLYLFIEERIRYFKTNKAFSQIDYHLGGGKEAQVTVALSQNITRNWNAGLDFNRLGTQGFLKNSSTFHSNINLCTWLHTENNRYNVFAYAYWNIIENEVNGGLHSDSVFDGGQVSNLAMQGLLVNLTDAKHHFRNRKFSVRQFYEVGHKMEEKTSDTTSVYHFKPIGRIEYSSNIESRSFTYLDINSNSFYENSFFSSASRDSIHYHDFRNRVSFSSISDSANPGNHLPFYYSAGLEHQWIRYSQFAYPDLAFIDKIFENTSVFGSLSNRDAQNKFFVKGESEYIFQGKNKDNYRANIFVRAPFHLNSAALSGFVALQSPDLLYQRYFSNHFTWENTLQKSLIKNVSLDFSFPKYALSFGAELTSIRDFIYMDSTSSPAQAKNEIEIVKLIINKNFRLGKFHLNNSFIFQKVNHEDALHLPAFITTQSLFYESAYYNKALLLQIGFDFNYNSLYYADAFMPATGLFYWQHEKKTGGYSLADFFVNLRIKTASVFFKLENVTDIFSDKGYYLVPHYPMQGLTFKFGFSWRFFDQ